MGHFPIVPYSPAVQRWTVQPLGRTAPLDVLSIIRDLQRTLGTSVSTAPKALPVFAPVHLEQTQVLLNLSAGRSCWPWWSCHCCSERWRTFDYSTGKLQYLSGQRNIPHRNVGTRSGLRYMLHSHQVHRKSMCTCFQESLNNSLTHYCLVPIVS